MLIVHLFISYALLCNYNLCHLISSSWCRGLAAASACGSSWTFLFTFFLLSSWLPTVWPVKTDQTAEWLVKTDQTAEWLVKTDQTVEWIVKTDQTAEWLVKTDQTAVTHRVANED